ncbi:MAG: ATP-binding protein [Bdellovibrionaceae bacterium]|nr:ATP-binding protein [Bdellovibrionales bacterium]MCB9084308.1 ATP-binding protein [Pseudobdellovibrionaceae bacterium]
MRIYSFVRKGLELVPIEVEINLMAGSNQLQIMGLPDTAIKESGLRIKSALKSQGFEWPAGQQILVNLRPSHWRKSSRGLELAIACGYLWRSGQVEPPGELKDEAFVYGELGLDGKVYAPGDLESLFDHPESVPILTGKIRGRTPHRLLSLENLSQVTEPDVQVPVQEEEAQFSDLHVTDERGFIFPAQVGRLLTMVACGEHPTLLAGPAGSGKTTFAQALHSLLSPPSPDQAREISRIRRWFNSPEERQRPFVCPHHTIPPMSMIGGGVPVFPGEITRAHGGLLVMDEFLEFHNQVKEALREPLEGGEIVISRVGQTQVLPARFQLLATTNLCHCGRLVPGKRMNCHYSLTRCRSYLEKLSGPLLDRFDVLAFSDSWLKGGGPLASKKKQGPTMNLIQISEQVQKVRGFQMQRTGEAWPRPNGRADGLQIAESLDEFTRENLLPSTGGSQRRARAMMRVARTLADMDLAEQITTKHIDEAAQWAWQSFEDLHRIFA